MGLEAGESRGVVNDRGRLGDPWIHLAVHAWWKAPEEAAGKGWGAVRGRRWTEPEPGPAHATGCIAGAAGGVEPRPG